MNPAASTDATSIEAPAGALLSGFELAAPAGALWLVVALPAIAAAVALVLWRRRARARLAEAGLLARIAPDVLAARSGLRATLLVVAIVSLSLALLDPRGGGRREKVEQTGIDVMFVVDVSRSMLAEDARPDRLTRARQFAADVVDALGGDRVGLVEFAGVPAMRCPLTFNHRAFLTQLETLSPQATVRGGSMLGDAIRMAASSLDAEGVGKVIVILSDGEDMESEPVEAASVALREQGIRVVAIGIGDPGDGARIPIETPKGRSFLVHEGEEVWSRMDPSLLREVAEAGGGFFVAAGTGQADMREVAELLRAGLDERTRDAREVIAKEPLFQWPAALALALLAAECLLGQVRRRPPAGRAPQAQAEAAA